jgi:hypothetical protein
VRHIEHLPRPQRVEEAAPDGADAFAVARQHRSQQRHGNAVDGFSKSLRIGGVIPRGHQQPSGGRGLDARRNNFLNERIFERPQAIEFDERLV